MPALFPCLYQVHTRAWLSELGPSATLDDAPDAVLDRWRSAGFDWIYLLGVWQTGPAGRAVSLSHAEWQAEYRRVLPDFTEADVSGSPFAVRAYTAHADFGGDAALARFRKRLADRGLRLMLDFVPNHTALDHPWAADRPEFFVAGTDDDLAREPHNYTRVDGRVFAHGRDPFFSGWPDTLQLNYRHAGLRAAVTEQLVAVAGRCDGVRCDMAMLLLPDVIARTWGGRALPADGTAPDDTPFWPAATAAVHKAYHDFTFMAEVYWGREWDLQQQGFDYTYDKVMYDRLHRRDPHAVRGHLRAYPDFQRKSVRFLENHDEPRATSVFPLGVHEAAAVVAFFVPGLRFFHEGQLEGWRAKLSVHLGRRPAEPGEAGLRGFYERLLGVLRSPVVREGSWRLLECREAWEGNPTAGNFVAGRWEYGGGRRLVCVNLGPTRGQCYVTDPLGGDLRGRTVTLTDAFGRWRYERSGDELAERGLYLDMPEWGYHVFDVTA